MSDVPSKLFNKCLVKTLYPSSDHPDEVSPLEVENATNISLFAFKSISSDGMLVFFENSFLQQSKNTRFMTDLDAQMTKEFEDAQQWITKYKGRCDEFETNFKKKFEKLQVYFKGIKE